MAANKKTIQNFFDSTGEHEAMNIDEVDAILDTVGESRSFGRAATPDEAVEWFRQMVGERIDAKSQREAPITRWGRSGITSTPTRPQKGHTR
ncbi:hypothetical protein LCGC14_0353290 [marine sediment metagenome]|uniref:Uncharacterized protein n=1 Tax=marine sediment metagenome TaxID=412755 RepID=A0A0F9TT20_9ZZZZ